MSVTAIEALRGWISTGALLGLLTLASRLWLQNRKLRMQEKIEDRQGLAFVIEGMGKEIDRLSKRVATLETEKEHDHNLIVELLRQMSRTQAVSILASKTVSPALRRALESTIGPEGKE